MKKSAKSIVYIALYVDDNLMIGDMVAIDNTIAALKSKGLVLKIVQGLHDCLFCEIKISDDTKKFRKCMKDVWSHKTPGMPKLLIVKPMAKSKKFSAKDQQNYWPGVGMLLFLVKHLCPNLANITRELS